MSFNKINLLYSLHLLVVIFIFKPVLFKFPFPMIPLAIVWLISTNVFEINTILTQTQLVKSNTYIHRYTIWRKYTQFYTRWHKLLIYTFVTIFSHLKFRSAISTVIKRKYILFDFYDAYKLSYKEMHNKWSWLFKNDLHQCRGSLVDRSYLTFKWW